MGKNTVLHVAFFIMSCLRGKSVGASKRTKLYSLLNIKTPVQEVIDAVKKELAIPIPVFIGQKRMRQLIPLMRNACDMAYP